MTLQTADQSQTTGSRILDQGRTPDEWAAYLAMRGIKVQPDTIRKRANELGLRHKCFGALLITGEQFDRIMEEGAECRSSQNSGEASGRLSAASNTTAGQLPDISVLALDHLQKQAHGRGSARSKKGKSGVISWETKRKS